MATEGSPRWYAFWGLIRYLRHQSQLLRELTERRDYNDDGLVARIDWSIQGATDLHQTSEKSTAAPTTPSVALSNPDFDVGSIADTFEVPAEHASGTQADLLPAHSGPRQVDPTVYPQAACDHPRQSNLHYHRLLPIHFRQPIRQVKSDLPPLNASVCLDQAILFFLPWVVMSSQVSTG